MKNIIIITQIDPFFTSAFLRQFDKYNLSFSVINMPNFNKGFFWGLKRAHDLYGFGIIKLIFLGIFNKLSFKLKNCIRTYNVSCSDEIDKILDEFGNGGVILSLSAPSRLPIERYKDNFELLNIHCGRLPNYAGMMPIFWQILDGNKYITVTLHNLDKEIDTGKILIEQKINVHKTLFDTSVVAKKISADIFYNWINNPQNKINSIENNEGLQLKKFPNKEDIVRFKKNYKLI